MKKKICILVALIIILGTVLTLTIGLNVSLDYSGYTMVEANIGQEYKISDIKKITDEVFPKTKIEIQKASEYDDMLYLRLEGITEEQKTMLCQKINEKYNTEIKIEEIEVQYIANAKLRDLITPFIIPVIISTILIIAYMAIRYRKQGVVGIILQTGILLVISEWLFLSLLAITRYPINQMIISAVLLIYYAVLLTLNFLYEKENVQKTITK